MKRRQYSGVSLFAFQDVLTAVIGVMVVVLLVISFEITGVVGVLGKESSILDQSTEEYRIKKELLENKISQLDHVISKINFAESNANPDILKQRSIYREKLRTEYDIIRRYQVEVEIEEDSLKSSILKFIQSEDNYNYLKKYQDKIRMESELAKIRDSDHLTYYVSSNESRRNQTLFLCIRNSSTHFISSRGGQFSTDISGSLLEGSLGLELERTIKEFLKNQEIRYVLLLVHPSGFEAGASFANFFNERDSALKIEYGIQVLSSETSCEDIKFFIGE